MLEHLWTNIKNDKLVFREVAVILCPAFNNGISGTLVKLSIGFTRQERGIKRQSKTKAANIIE